MAPRVAQCKARVEAVRSLTPEIREVDLRMEDPPEFRFDAGQWVSVPFGPKTVRAYSMASPPSMSKLLTLCADVAPGGIGSKWFMALKPGDLIEFKGPTGGFIFNRADPRRPLFVAEEIGIVPIRSILWDLYQTGFGRPATLIYWSRDPSWLAYDREFRLLSRRYPGFSYFPAVREATGGWTGDNGEPEETVERTVPSVEGLVAYVAGGHQMINTVREVLLRKGLDRKSVKWEKFW
ncbi:MAG: FAD-binding oxidoreductase [Candidatus Methylomirabilia bacterium]